MIPTQSFLSESRFVLFLGCEQLLQLGIGAASGKLSSTIVKPLSVGQGGTIINRPGLLLGQSGLLMNHQLPLQQASIISIMPPQVHAIVPIQQRQFFGVQQPLLNQGVFPQPAANIITKCCVVSNNQAVCLAI